MTFVQWFVLSDSVHPVMFRTVASDADIEIKTNTDNVYTDHDLIVHSPDNQYQSIGMVLDSVSTAKSYQKSCGKHGLRVFFDA